MSLTKFLSIVNSTNAKILLASRSRQLVFVTSRRDYRSRTYDATIKWQPMAFKGRPNRHWNPKFSYMRKLKFIKVNLDGMPSYDKQKERNAAMDDGPEAMNEYMKKEGIPPVRPYKDRGRDRPIHVSSTGSIFEAYIPPEGDGRVSRLSREGVGQMWDQLASRSKELLIHTRGVRKYDDDFDPKTFGETVALPIFIEAHQALMNRDIDRLHELITEHAFSVMYEENRLRSVRWELVESLEPARVVHVRRTGVIHQDNTFGQVTVRLHTKQKLAIYDQFGRLLLGSNDIARDVLEYVVFERHLVDPYGAWRLHSKITPKWLPQKDAIIPTFEMVKHKKHDVGEDVQAEEFVPVPDEEGKPSAQSV